MHIDTRRKRILILTKYGARAASTRYRFLQYFDYLQKAGFDSVCSYGLQDEYLALRFGTGKVAWWWVVKGLLRRIFAILSARKFDVVVIYCEAFPYFPPILEWYLQMLRIPYVVDMDDAIFHSYDQHRNRLIRAIYKNKIPRVLHGARYVLAGNKYLAEFASRYNDHVLILPTVVDVARFAERPKSIPQKSVFTIGWIGSPTTAIFLYDIFEAIRKLAALLPLRVLVVGSGPLQTEGLPIEVREWSESEEVKALAEMDVGIMPLPDSPWTRGKCGFKLIQYMAASLPVVASPIGVNAEIVTHEEQGFLAENTDEWVAALLRLYEDSSLRVQMGGAARKKVEAMFDVRVAFPVFIQSLEECLR